MVKITCNSNVQVKDRDWHENLFPDGQEGEINIELQKNGGEEFSLVIGDNGIGLPEGMDFRNTESLGLQLVNFLAA